MDKGHHVLFLDITLYSHNAQALSGCFHTSSEAIRYELASEAGRHEMRALPPPL